MKFSARFVVIAVIAATAFSHATADTYKIDNAHSSIGFKVHQFISATTGSFKQFSGTIELDREHAERSAVSATIQVKSIDTGIAKRDRHLLSPEFFDAEKYPEIIFKSRSVKRTGPQSADIAGDFTMHGVTKPITLHVKLVTLKDEASMQRSRWEVTTDPLKRRDFKLMFGSTAEAISGISQDVAIKIDIEATRAR